jgi:hypothetical protein
MFFITQKTNHKSEYNSKINPGYIKKDNESQEFNIRAYVPPTGSSYVKFNYIRDNDTISICEFQNPLGAGHIKKSVDTTVRVLFFKSELVPSLD